MNLLEEFTLILWNPSIKLWDDILKQIPNITEKKEFFIKKENLKNFILDIYKYDIRCDHDVVLPIKINALSKYNTKHLAVKINIENPVYVNKICQNVVDLKNKIRKKFNIKTPEGPQGLIHICDDNEQSKCVWKKCVNYWNYAGYFNIGNIDNFNSNKVIEVVLNKLEQEQINFLILRGSEELEFKTPLLDNNEDIDILIAKCGDINNVFGYSHNIIIENGKGNYVRIKLDDRYVGDNYYDEKWQIDMLNSKVKKNFYYVLDKKNNYYSTLYHCLLHKGYINNKYLNLFNTYENEVLSINNPNILKRYYILLKFMFENEYKFTDWNYFGDFKSNYKLNHFILRKTGIKKYIIDYLKNELHNNGYEIIANFLVTLNNKEKFLKEFYGEKFDLYKEDILSINDNQCLVFITNFQEDKDPNVLKMKIRNYAAASSNCKLYNIIHCSDNPEECEKELYNLINNNILDFKNVGTYYSQVNPKCYNIFKMGSCRSEMKSHIFNINSNPGYLHTTKEILHFLDFMDGTKKFTDVKYPEIIIPDYNNYNCKLQKKILDNSHIVLIEISSIKIFHDKNTIYQQDYLSTKFSEKEYKNMNITSYKLSEEQLIEDIILIKKRINKPIIFMGHIDYNIKELNLTISLNSDFRLEGRNMITRVLKKYADYSIIYEDIESDIHKICPLYENTQELDITYLSKNGKKIIEEYFNRLVNKII